MTHATLNQLVAQLSGPKVTGFFLVLARVSPLFVLAPVFSSKMIPAKVKGIVALALSLGLTPIATHGQHIPSEPLEFAGVMLGQLVVGFGFAFALSAMFAAVSVAGFLTDSVTGFNFGSMVDPLNGNQGGAMTQVYEIVGLMIFLAIGGDAWMLRGLARTYDLVPLTRPPKLVPLVGGAEHAFSVIFTSAIEIAAPAMLALVITDVAFGIVSRVVPQLNVFAVGFPVKIGIGLLIVAATLPFLGGWMTDQVQSSVISALHSIQVA
jgi:flagellar biosynthetic protein FliR